MAFRVCGSSGDTIPNSEKLSMLSPELMSPELMGLAHPGYDLPPLAARERSCDRGHRRDLGLAHPQGEGKGVITE